jgi:hypothetical protein
MAHIITVTIAGGAYLGPENDYPIQINADKIVKIEKPFDGEIGNSVVVMENDERLYIKETTLEIATIINRTKL